MTRSEVRVLDRAHRAEYKGIFSFLPHFHLCDEIQGSEPVGSCLGHKHQQTHILDASPRSRTKIKDPRGKAPRYFIGAHFARASRPRGA